MKQLFFYISYSSLAKTLLHFHIPKYYFYFILPIIYDVIILIWRLNNAIFILPGYSKCFWEKKLIRSNDLHFFIDWLFVAISSQNFTKQLINLFYPNSEILFVCGLLVCTLPSLYCSINYHKVLHSIRG